MFFTHVYRCFLGNFWWQTFSLALIFYISSHANFCEKLYCDGLRRYFWDRLCACPAWRKIHAYTTTRSLSCVMTLSRHLHYAITTSCSYAETVVFFSLICKHIINIGFPDITRSKVPSKLILKVSIWYNLPTLRQKSRQYQYIPLYVHHFWSHVPGAMLSPLSPH